MVKAGETDCKGLLAHLFSLCFFLLANPLAAQDAPLGLTVEDFGEHWRWRTFTHEDSLPPGSPTALGRDRDDMIYVGTAKGLFRYNGYYWTRITSAESIEPYPIEEIFEANRLVFVRTPRDLWVIRGGLELHRIVEEGPMLLAASPRGDAFVIDLPRRKHFRIEKEAEFAPVAGDPPGEPNELYDYVVDVVDNRPIHWLATSGGLYQRDIQKGYPWKIDVRLNADMRELPCKRLLLVEYVQTKRDPYSYRVGASRPTYELWARFEDGDGKPILLRQRRQDKSWEWVRVLVGSANPVIDEILRDGHGNFYALTERGQLYFSRDGDSWEPVRRIGIEHVKLRSGLVDAYGLVWYAFEYSMGMGGVAWFDPLSQRWEKIQAGSEPDEPDRRKVLSVLETADGTVWVGTVSGLYRSHMGKTYFDTKFGQTTVGQVSGLAEDADGNVWISGEGFNGTFSFTKGVWVPERPNVGGDLNSHPIWRIVPGRRRDLWFLSTQRSPGGQGSRLYRLTLSRFGDDELETLDVSRGRVRDFREAQDGSYWIATEEGLVHMSAGRSLNGDRKQKVYGEQSGLLSSRIWALAENPADGSIWVCYETSGCGVTQIEGETIRHFDQRSGLASPKIWSISVTLSSSGSRVWLGTDGGLVCFDGDCWYHYPVASLDPKWTNVLSLFTQASGEFVDVGTYNYGAYRFRLENPRRPRFLRGRLSSSRNRDGSITFAWDARDYKAQTPPEELLFRTRVDERPWTMFAEQRAVNIKGLEPGITHTFQVEVRDRDGNSAREPLSERFRVEAGAPVPLWFVGLLWGGGIVMSVSLVVLAVRAFRRNRQPILRLRHAFDGFGEPVLMIDQQSRIVDFNGARPQLLGIEEIPKQQWSGLPVHLIPALAATEVRGLIQQALAGVPGLCELNHLSFLRDTSLRVRAVPLRRGPREADVVSGVLLSVEDVTAAVRERTDRRRRGRMGAIRDLSDRLQEEMNEILEGLQRNLALFHSATSPDCEADLDGLRSEIDRLEELVQVLRDFSSRELSGQKERVSAVALLEELLLKRENGGRGLPAEVEIDFRSPPGLWLTSVEAKSTRHALEEILRNAAEAMPEGGKVKIRLSNRRLEAAEGELSPGRYVAISIADSGTGIDSQEVERIFEPLYTTKARNRHRGLGLSVAYAIVRRQGGSIEAERSPDGGTLIRVLFPEA